MPTPDAPIRFGTSGWRGILGKEVTPARVRALAAAASRWFAGRAPGAPVIVGHDTRRASADFARIAATALREAGLVPIGCERPLPTPVLVHAVTRHRAAGALVLTASHNPPSYHGLKVFAEWGGAVDDDEARAIEKLAEDELTRAPAERRGDDTLACDADLASEYSDSVLEALDVEAIRRGGLDVVYDAMHGAGAGVLAPILERAGANVATLRSTPDPKLGGSAPDPRPEQLVALRRRLSDAGSGLRLGLATDGDADRFAAVDAGGDVLAAHHALAVLIDHLARTGRVERGVALSIATGSLVDRVAADHGLSVTRHPIGFKHLSKALRDGRADAAGEESDGFAWSRLGFDKDGILAGCLLAEIVAATGAPLAARIAELEARHGRSACGRRAVRATRATRSALARLAEAAPERVDGAVVRDVVATDGLLLLLPDGFLMWRASGTEPLVRIYAEAPDDAALARRLDAGGDLLGRAPSAGAA